MNMKKILVLALSLVLVAAISITGTLAWLQDETTKIQNTFTVGNISIDLRETKGTLDNTNTDTTKTVRDFKMVPGNIIEKDPKVTINAGSEASYVFVKIEKSTNLDSFISYEIADNWIPLTGVDGVYYRLQDATTADTTYSVLKGDTVKVKDTVTKEMMDAIDNDTATEPTMTFTAYAVQQANVADEAAAWKIATGVADTE